MAVQYTTYNTDGTTRTFPSTKHIATIQHVGVYLKRVVDNVWVVVNVNDYALVQNSIIFDTAPDSVLYAQVEVRVADDAVEITTSPSDIALVAGSIVNVDTVATNIGAVNTVATNVGAVTTTSGSIANVNTVAANIVNVNLTAGNTVNINAVVANAANITAVGLDLLEPISEINTVALSIANVDAVGSAITNVNAVGTNIANINSVATTIVPNIAEILLADDNATIATNKALEASNSATATLGYLNDFKGRYYGALASDPTLDPLGAAITNGDVYYNSTSNELRYYNGSWIAWNISTTQLASLITNATSKAIPVGADLIGIVDSADSFSLKKLTIANLKKIPNTGTITNDNALAGDIGEHISSSVLNASPISLTTGVVTTVTSISLPAGDWDVSGKVGFISSGTTSISRLTGAINSSVVISSDLEAFAQFVYPGGSVLNTAANGTVNMPVGKTRISLSAPTTIYLVANSTFAVSTLSVYGTISARRVR